MAVVADSRARVDGEFRWSIRRQTDTVMRLLRGADSISSCESPGSGHIACGLAGRVHRWRRRSN